MALPRFLKPVLGLLTILVLNVLSGTAFAAPQAGSTAVAPRIVTAVDETKLVPLPAALTGSRFHNTIRGQWKTACPWSTCSCNCGGAQSRKRLCSIRLTNSRIRTPANTINGLRPRKWERNSALHNRISKLLPNG